MPCRDRTRIIALCSAFALAACGGGGGDAAPSITVGGTAAVGAAIAGGSVSVQCASGSGSATTAANGSYSVTVNPGTAPCLVRVTGGGTTLYSMVAAGSTSPATVNITPLTSLMTAQVLRADPATAFVAFDAAAQARLTPANIASAHTDLTTALNGRVDIAGIDPIGAAFAVGDPIDQRLDQLAAVLSAANTTLAELATALVTNPGSPDPVRNLVAPSAATCAALKSGEYWGIEPRDPLNSIDDSPPVRLDATTLTATYDHGLPTQEEVTLVPVPNAPCRFTISDDSQIDGPEEIAVSSSGIFATRFSENGLSKGAIGFPRTTLTTAELAGSYNYVGYGQEGATFLPINGSLDIAADGTISNSRNYINLTDDTQQNDNTPRRLVQRSDGTYNDRDLTTSVTSPTRWLPHKTADGVVTIFVIGIDLEDDIDITGVAVLRRQTVANASAQPVGTVTPFWEVLYNAAGVSAVTTQSIRITSIDTASTPNTVSRIRLSDDRVDTRAFNSPRPGLVYRALNSCTDGVGGPALECTETVSLPAQGTGFSVLSGGPESNGLFTVSVTRP